MSVVAHNDREAVKILKKLPDSPPMSVRVLAEPCTFLMAKDDERVETIRDGYGGEEYAR